MKHLILLATLIISPALFADDSDYSGNDPTQVASTDSAAAMTEARTLIGEKNYKGAIKKLKQAVRADRKNADAWNLLGYSNRKLEKYRAAAKAYKKALKINPQHKGALEYQGELFIETNKLDRAKENLDRLATLCPTGCDELRDLENALKAVN